MLGELAVFWVWKSGLFKPSLGNYESQNGPELALQHVHLLVLSRGSGNVIPIWPLYTIFTYSLVATSKFAWKSFCFHKRGDVGYHVSLGGKDNSYHNSNNIHNNDKSKNNNSSNYSNNINNNSNNNDNSSNNEGRIQTCSEPRSPRQAGSSSVLMHSKLRGLYDCYAAWL